MSNVLLINGSPTAVSRSGALLEYSRKSLESKGIEVKRINILDFPAEDLIQARYASDSFSIFISEVAAASGLVVSTPVYKASFSGGLKSLLDILPQDALLGKAILPLATAGTISHLLAIDYALKRVLSVLGARDIEQGVFAVDDQFEKNQSGYTLKPELEVRLERNLDYLSSRILT